MTKKEKIGWGIASGTVAILATVGLVLGIIYGIPALTGPEAQPEPQVWTTQSTTTTTSKPTTTLPSNPVLPDWEDEEIKDKGPAQNKIFEFTKTSYVI